MVVAGADYKITQAVEVVVAAAPGVSEAVLQPQPVLMVASLISGNQAPKVLKATA